MRILIVDDHPIMRLGVHQLVAQAWPEAEIIEAQSVEGAASALSQTVDILISDLSLPDASGIEAPARLLRLARGAPILVLSQNDESTYAQRLLQMGVSGYLPKIKASAELVLAVKRILDGGRYVTQETADRLLDAIDGKVKATTLPHERLSKQEYRLMQLIAAGRSPAEIAKVMYLSVKTVSSYRARVLNKGGWANNIELTKYCMQHGLTDAG